MHKYLKHNKDILELADFLEASARFIRYRLDKRDALRTKIETATEDNFSKDKVTVTVNKIE